MFLKLSLLHVVVLLFVSCTYKEYSNKDMHHKKNSKLSVIMRELNVIVYDKDSSELEKDDSRKRYALTLADAVKKLSLEAEGLSPQDANRKIFKSYASRLYKDAQNIENIANSYEIEKLPSAISSMKSTCNACHKQIRD